MVIKYTPGPWKLTSYGRCIYSEAFGYGNHSVAVICPIQSPSTGKWEDLANARLIAAAPDMLEALKIVLPTMGESFPITQDIIRQAIAKAEGNDCG